MKLVDFFKSLQNPHTTNLIRIIQRFEKCILSTYQLFFPGVSVKIDYLKRVIRKGIQPDTKRLIYIFPLITNELFLKISLNKPDGQNFHEDESALSFVLFQKLFDLRQNILQSQQIEVIESILSNFLDYAIAFYISWDTDIKEETILEVLTTLRMSAFHTYEDEKINLGVLISEHYESKGKKTPSLYLGQFNRDLLDTKRFLKMVDGWATVYVINSDGVLLDITRLQDLCGSKSKPVFESPTPQALLYHSLATRPRGNVCFTLTQRGQIFIFKYGSLILELSTGEWRHKQTNQHFQMYSKDVTNPELARKTYQLAMELSLRRKGGIISIVKNTNHIQKFLYKQDTMAALKPYDSPTAIVEQDALKGSTTRKGNIMLDIWSVPKFNKNQTFNYLMRNKTIFDIPLEILINIASIDGATVIDTEGNLLAFGAIIKNIRQDKRLKIFGKGSRYVAGLWASLWGPTLEISADGQVSYFKRRKKIWQE